MHFQFLVEDYSGEVLIDQIMSKLVDKKEFSYDIKSFKGIGGFKKSRHASDIKTNKILNDLIIYLRGFDKYFAQYDAAIFIVLDNDNKDVIEFRKQLYSVASASMVTIDYVFCIAVEEMEAWLLGDKEAIVKAYPNARMGIYKEYIQDSICGTWEVLANIVYRGGLKKLRKDCQTYSEIGKLKSEWAEKIGKYIEFKRNESPSFKYFITEITKRLEITI